MVSIKELSAIKGKDSGPRLAGMVEQMFDLTQDQSRQILDRITWRNILYLCGEQYLTFMHGNFFRPNLPKNMPTPVTNLIKDFVRAIKAMLLNQKLVPKVSPNTNEPEDQKAADLAGKLLTWMDGINDGELAEEKEKLVVWLCVSGTAFLRTYPDMNSGRWIMTPKGDVRSGEVATRCVYPLSVKMDTIGDSLRAKRWIGLQTLYAKEYVEDIFKAKIDAGDVASLTDYERKMAKFVAQVSPWKGEGLNQQVYEDDTESVLVRELEFKPTKEWPEGRYLVTCARKTLLDVDRLPIQSEDDDWYYTLTDFHYDYVPGRFWSDAPINDLISPQNDINQIDQLAAVNRKGLGRPRIISPGTINLEEITSKQQSHAFLSIKYDPLLSGGKEPKIEPGIPLPAQIYEERAVKMTAIQDVSGDPKNIMRGQAPSAASSGVQIDILRETAERGHYPDIERFNRGMGRVYKKRLLVASEVYSDKRMIKIAGRGQRLEIIAFRASDLRGNTDVKLELDSGISTTKAGQTTLLMQLAKEGFLGPIDVNPELREEFLSRLGLSGYTSQSNEDIARAETENASVSLGRPQGLFIIDPEAIGPDGSPEVVNMDPLFKYDDHAIHFKVHRRFILSGQFSELKPQAKTILLAHADAHQTQMIMEIQQQQAAAQAQQGSPGEQPGQQGGGPGGGNSSPMQPRKTPMGNPMEQTETTMARGGQ